MSKSALRVTYPCSVYYTLNYREGKGAFGDPARLHSKLAVMNHSARQELRLRLKIGNGFISINLLIIVVIVGYRILSIVLVVTV